MEDFEEEWKMLCEGKSVCITDPSRSGTVDEFMEALKDKKCEDSFCIDCPGDLPNEEFYRRLMNGEYDEKIRVFFILKINEQTKGETIL